MRQVGKDVVRQVPEHIAVHRPVQCMYRDTILGLDRVAFRFCLSTALTALAARTSKTGENEGGW